MGPSPSRDLQNAGQRPFSPLGSMVARKREVAYPLTSGLEAFRYQGSHVAHIDEEPPTITALTRGRAKTTAGPSARARVVVLAGDAPVGRRFPIGDSLVIGRADEADITVDDLEASRRHARIYRKPDKRYVVEDLNSRNGITVNGERVTKWTLSFGDEIRLGATVVLLFAHHDPQEERVIEAQKMEALGRLGAGVAHDFNNLSGAVLATVEYLRALPPGRRLDDPDVQACHEDIAIAASRAADLAGRLTATARRPAEDFEAVDIGEVAREVVKLAARTFPRAIKIELDESGITQVLGDPVALHQVVLNLAINARDAMPTGGELRIEASRSGDKEELVVLRVNDTGVGMNTETRRRAFEPFFTTKARAAGTGLGLAMVYDIVRTHGGTVEIESVQGRGTSLTVRIPALRQDQRPLRRKHRMVTRQDARSQLAPQGVRVLLVEDEEVVARSTARLLRHRGYEVSMAGGGGEALRFFTTGKKPTVVLLDLDMPGMSGEETFHKMQAIEPLVRVLFLSGHRDPEREREVRDAGALEFLHKPCGAEALDAAIRAALIHPLPEQL